MSQLNKYIYIHIIRNIIKINCYTVTYKNITDKTVKLHNTIIIHIILLYFIHKYKIIYIIYYHKEIIISKQFKLLYTILCSVFRKYIKNKKKILH